MRMQACPTCYLCGNIGVELYHGIKDGLFGSQGSWNLRRCGNDGLVWLDPMPSPEDIGLAYSNYYTHEEVGAGTRTGKIARAFAALRTSLVSISGLEKEQRKMHLRYLGTLVPGRLLEVGCGSGEFLARMRDHGWLVEGVEIDPVSSERARETHQLGIHTGTLESAGYADGSIDAVIINHVIEHVYDPVALIRECKRIVRPGGPVVILTPNIQGWGHRKFGASWMGLDPPRHLMLFSPSTILRCAKLAGFEKIEVTTTPANAEIMLRPSLDIQNDGEFDMFAKGIHPHGFMERFRRRITILLYELWEYYLWTSDPWIGEEVVMICRNSPAP